MRLNVVFVEKMRIENATNWLLVGIVEKIIDLLRGIVQYY